MSVIESAEMAQYVVFLAALADRRAEKIRGTSGDVVLRAELRNRLDYDQARAAESLIRELDGRDVPVRYVLFENALLSAGKTVCVLLDSDSGVNGFERERDRIASRRQREDELLFPAANFNWRDRIDGQDFEDFVRELLACDPLFVWIRPVGSAREPDRGRDLLACIRPIDRPNARWEPGKRSDEIIVLIQCKAYQKTVGIRDVPDLRDTIEDHGAQGYILVTSAKRISRSVVEKLESVTRTTEHYTDWYDRRELEIAMKKNPQVVRNFRAVAVAEPQSSSERLPGY